MGNWGIWLLKKVEAQYQGSHYGGAGVPWLKPPFLAFVYHSSQVAIIFHSSKGFSAALLSSWPSFYNCVQHFMQSFGKHSHWGPHLRGMLKPMPTFTRRLVQSRWHKHAGPGSITANKTIHLESNSLINPGSVPFRGNTGTCTRTHTHAHTCTYTLAQSKVQCIRN